MILGSTKAEVADAVARIEIQRQEREKESGVPVSCGWALGKLHEVLSREGNFARTSTESTALRANIEAATRAIGRLRKLAQIAGQRAMLKSNWPWRRQRSWRDARGDTHEPPGSENGKP